MSTSRNLDQFYTNVDIAKHCYNIFDDFITDNEIIFDLVLEPSAGTGSFYNQIKYPKLGIDIDPKIDNIIKMDFMNFIPDRTKQYVTLGNPPFGKNSSLAVKFFNKSSEFSSLIGFIIPKTFKKKSIQNRLNPYFHLVYEYDIPSNSFIYDGNVKDVPTVFQIWKKENHTRIKNKKLSCDQLEFTNKSNGNFAFQRVGVNAGKIKTISDKISDSSHYYIKCSPDIKKYLEKYNWDSIKNNTAGNPSISKNEIIEVIIAYVGKPT